MLALLMACRHPAETNESPVFTDSDGASLKVLADGLLELTATNGTVQSFELAFGFVGSYDPIFNYDPYSLKDPVWASAVPAGLSWAIPESAEWDGSCFQITLSNREKAELFIEADSGIGLRWRQKAGSPYAPYARIRAEIDGSPGFYGLGETFDGVEHTDTIHAMHMVYDATLESSYNEAHVPVPLLISTAGWGVLVESYRPGVVDVGAESAGVVELIFEQSDDFNAFFYGPPAPVDVVARYHQQTGLPELPPSWAFAPLQWRNVAADSAMIRDDAAQIRANDVATGLIWVDNPWQSSYNSMQPNTEQFPDFTELVAELQAAGFRFMAWTTPYIEEADPEYQHYVDSGWLVDAPILFSDFGPLIDFTNPEAFSAWEGRVAAAKALGIEGWKLDYGEDLQIGIGSSRVQFGLYSGETERTLHHRWAELFHTPYATPYQEQGFLLGRSGGLGTQDTTDCIWPGDLDSDFRVFRDNLHVGGLPAAIRGGTSLSASGFPFYASDTGGFRHNRPTHETMIRWTEYSALLPIMQYGGGGVNHNPWDFTPDGDSQFTEETLSMFKRYASLHTRLFPYFYELSRRVALEGGAVIVAQGLAWPEENIHSQSDFMVGPSLFVAPVEVEGALEREIVLPPGNWVHWWSGESVSGEVVVAAPLGEGPLFIKEGGIVPMLRPSVMSLSPSDGSVDSWADDPGRLYARVVPGEGEGFMLESGESLEWKEGGLEVRDGSLYTGWAIEIYAPEGRVFSFNGEVLEEGEEGCSRCVVFNSVWPLIVVPEGGMIGW
jgi:alpha-D-xyloside xylohydrolase